GLFPDGLPRLDADETIDGQALLGLELADDLLRRGTETAIDRDGPAAFLQLRLELANACTVAGPVAGMVLLVRRLNAVPVAPLQRELRCLPRLAGRLLLRQLTDNLRSLGRPDSVLACIAIHGDLRLLLQRFDGLHRAGTVVTVPVDV